MADNLTTQVQTLTDDIFAELMNEVPAGTVNSTTLIGSEKPKDEKQEKVEGKEVKTKTAQAEEKKEEAPAATQEELDQQLKEALGDEDDSDEDDEKGKDKSKIKKVDVDADTNASLFKAKAEGLIERGIWREFEGQEEFEWTDENYGELAKQQAIWDAEDKFAELIDETGDYGKAIISHIKNGGDPKEIIDLFKESKKIESFDISTEEGKIALLTKYYKDQGFNDKKAKRIIDSAVDDGSLDQEVTEAKEEMEAAIKEQVAETQKEQAAYLAKQKELNDQFANNITGTLRERKDLSIEQKKAIASSLLVYDKKLQDGRMVNQFTLDFAKLQQDPKKYIDLVMFVQDYDKFVGTIAKTEEKKAAKKSWEFIKGNGSVKASGSPTHSKTQKQEKEDLVIDWKQGF